MYINNQARIVASDLINTNGIIHIIDRLLSPQNLLVTPKDASGRVLVGDPRQPSAETHDAHESLSQL